MPLPRLKLRREVKTPSKVKTKNIKAPVLGSIFHSLINFHSSPKIKAKTTSSDLFEFK